ncbi:hypothetical protein AAE478_006905 [Parahypoxylon ruwenzoriense]
MIRYMSSSKSQPNSDKDKTMKAVYEVVIGKAERLLPLLGQDMNIRVKTVQEYLSPKLHIFGEVCDNVYTWTRNGVFAGKGVVNNQSFKG